MPGLINRLTGAPNRGSTPFQRVPDPGSETAQEASAYYDQFYGSMPIPATAFATSSTALRSIEVEPSVRTAMSNASVVQRANHKDGMISVGGYQQRKEPTPQIYENVDSSKFQTYLIGPNIDFSMNDKWYIAYPAATISLGTDRNMALSERVPQLPTRTSGGPGPGAMMPAPRFKSVQTVPRYSTMPSMYPTASSPG